MAQQQAEPRPESFGFMPEIQEHVPEEMAEEPQQRQSQQSGKRTVAVSRRGRDDAPRGSAQMDDQESDDSDGLGADDDLDASGDLSQDDADVDAGDELDAADADLEGDDADADAGNAKGKGKGRAAPDKDSKTRAQWAEANGKLQGQIESLQRQIESLTARNSQADDAQSRQQAAQTDDDLSELLDDLFTTDADKDGFVKAGELEARTKNRKKLEKQIGARVQGAVDAYATDEVKALWAIPEARKAWADAQQNGVADKARKEHQHLGPLIFTILHEQHVAQIKSLEAKYAKEINNLKQKLRQGRLDEIPAGSGNRGGRGTGSGNRRPMNPMERAMAGISQKQGIPAR